MIRTLLATALLLVASVAVSADARAVGRASADKDRAAAAQLVYGLTSNPRYAYRSRKPDDALSSQVFDAYLDALGRASFSAGDLQGFEKYRQSLDEAVMRGKLDPIYEIAAASVRPSGTPLDRDQVLEAFLNAYVETIDPKQAYYSPFVGQRLNPGSRPPVRAVTTKSVLETDGKRVGVIALGKFDADRPASGEVARMLSELSHAGVNGVLLDLRGNGGGSLREVIALEGLFLGRVPMMQIRESNGRISLEGSDTDQAWAGPLAVLVDRATTSGAEMLVAALQDHGRALVIGETTDGTGTLQNPVDMDLGYAGATPRYGRVNLTIAEVFRLDGSPLDRVGVIPDIALENELPALHKRDTRPASEPIRPARDFKAPMNRVDTAALKTRLKSSASVAGTDVVLDQAASLLIQTVVGESDSSPAIGR
jgi:hypothetical protein